MSLFAIADLHLSLGCDKPMDVFSGWQNYTERLEKNWRAVVGRDDTVVIAGDISWAMNLEEAVNDFSFIHSLPGKKLILKGNHDYWWSTRKKIVEFLERNGLDTIQIIHNNAVVVGDIAVCGTRGWLYNAETDEDVKIVNREVGRLNASIDDAERQGAKPVVFLHYPPVYDGAVCKEILDVLKERGIQKCYFGHIHGSQAARRAITGEYEGIKMVLISCDYLNFMPVLV
ncbi:serine/threonine protein phosphatase [Caproiciproducens galactitolivorans]|uniref:3',5'-cyclic adenosine monophosphate phosphodiesterase CpdA n=1 Tax=Caproiciproducens galactitolivorans TaxID=642589 RepID=A0A4Z0YI43_9FIRM|nr:metallophosphoesterase [Caproiciproducens galactitolivorans]QEY34055.1 serine/threonine protein phosphatase [Caproiciproducens galactitolivorans]TGJ76532.1 3',5'-cyclic adenosine monophosphate phosphodiesterase CpdA [Caproiciproducens galactitolivorans]